MALTLTFGIDPGLSGAIVTLIDGEPGPMIDMPTYCIGEKTEVDGSAIAAFVREQRGANPGAYVSACVELVGAIPMEGRRQGSTSSFNFGESSGKVKAVLEALGVPYSRAIPSVWKRRFGLIGKDKDAARQLALVRFPSVAAELKRKKDSGRADALLLALWHESSQIGTRAA
jgi:hypothetical protein